jgi:putative transposase
VPRSSVYRRRCPRPSRAPGKRPRPRRALTETQRQEVLAEARSERFVDRSPEYIVTTLLEEGKYHCSIRTLYRILAQVGETTPRRRQRKHPPYRRPELMATAPNQTWTWDITLLRGPHRGVYYRLYVVLDLFSRYIVGWLLARTENGKLAARLLRDACNKQGIEQSQLIVHADRGTAATSKTVADMLDALGVSRSFSRPRVSDDNAFSEAQFKHLKYSPHFPDRFASFADALAFCREFFAWYNREHRHSGLAFFTPSAVHHGQVEQLAAIRNDALARAYTLHPERFVHGPPVTHLPPDAVYINPPENVIKTKTNTNAH